jgi:hypothetical protein
MSYMMGFFGPGGAGSPPTIEGDGGLATNNSSSNPAAVPYPAGLQADDIAFLHCIINDSVSANSISTPAGWTEVDQEILNGVGTSSHAVYWKRLTGSESGTVSVGTSGSHGVDDSLGGIMTIWRGCVASGTPYEGLANNTAQSTSITGAAVTTTGANRTILHFAATRGGNATTPAAGYTEEYEVTSSTGTVDLGLYLFSIERASAGNEASAIHAASFNLRWQTMALALIPA